VALSPQDLALARRAAHILGKSVSKFLRDVMVPEATRVLTKHKRACPHCGAKNTAAAA
jgi:uncharacterized protein (DUF1778 family)